MNVYLYQSWTEKELKNAYIGEVYEYSYDFRGKSTTILTNDGWTNAWSTPSFNSYGMTWSTIRYTKPISLSNAKKLVLSYTGTWGSDDEYWFRVWQTVTSSTRSWLTGTLYSLNNIYMNIYGTSQSYSWVSSWYHKVECIMDFTAKTFQIKLDWASFQNGTLTDTQISNIKNNTTVTFAYVSWVGSDYWLESIYILIEK